MDPDNYPETNRQTSFMKHGTKRKISSRKV